MIGGVTDGLNLFSKLTTKRVANTAKSFFELPVFTVAWHSFHKGTADQYRF